MHSTLLTASRLRVFGLLAVLVSSVTAYGAEVPDISVNSSVETQQAYIGDLLNYRIEITADTTVAVDSVPVRDELGPFSVRSHDYQIDSTSPGVLKHIIDLVIVPFETGELWIPSVSISATYGDTNSIELATDSIAISVLSLAEGDSLADIKGLKPPVTFGTKFPWGYVILAAVLVAAVVYLVMRRRKRVELESESEPVDTRPPWEIAASELKKLRESDLIENGQFKVYYFTLTDIIKAYLEPRYGIDALERTTYELRSELKRISLDEQHYGLLFDLLDSADLVKFAKHIPDGHQVDEDFQRAWRFVQITGETARTEAVVT
jgi:hypothetical protein